MPDAAKIIKDWCASCGMPEPSDGECHALAVAISAAAPVVLPEPVSDEQIKAVFLANGFTIKEGLTDLKPYVYQAARALLATGGQAQADMPDSFREWFAQNYPADTIIVDPDWHAKSIFRMAQAHARLAAPQAQADARDAGLGTARAFIEWVKAQPEDREQTTIDGALVEFEAHIAAIAAAKGG